MTLQALGFKLAEIDVLVAAHGEDDRLHTGKGTIEENLQCVNNRTGKSPVEVNVVNTSQMSRQFVNQLLTVNIPHVHIPNEKKVSTSTIILECFHLSELPAAAIPPSGLQAQWSKFFSKLCVWPVNT